MLWAREAGLEMGFSGEGVLLLFGAILGWELKKEVNLGGDSYQMY